MDQRYACTELDTDTLTYLRLVARNEGHGMPGIFVSASEARLWGGYGPLFACLCCPLVLAWTIYLCWGSVAGPGWLTLFLTAGGLLTCWLGYVAVRGFLARRSSTYLGHFLYVDPHCLYHARGTEVRLTSLDLITGAEARHHFNDSDAYKSSTVTIDLADGTALRKIYSRSRANQIEDFLNALMDIRGDVPVVRAYSALGRVRGLDDDEEKPDPLKTIPEPRKVRPSRSWLVYLVFAALGVALYFGSSWLALRLHDHATFQMALTRQPSYLRAYLNNPRFTLHREEAVRALARHYESAATNLQNQGTTALTRPLADVVRGLNRDGRPVITVWFKKSDKKPDVPEGYLSSDHLATLQERFVEQLTPVMRRFAGESLVEFGEVGEGPAALEIEAKVIPILPEKGCKVEWTIRIRLDKEGAQPAVYTFLTERSVPGEDVARALRVQYLELPAQITRRLTDAVK